MLDLHSRGRMSSVREKWLAGQGFATLVTFTERNLMDHAPCLDFGGFRLCQDCCARLAAMPLIKDQVDIARVVFSRWKWLHYSKIGSLWVQTSLRDGCLSSPMCVRGGSGWSRKQEGNQNVSLQRGVSRQGRNDLRWQPQ
jgi:hypothetical protein